MQICLKLAAVLAVSFFFVGNVEMALTVDDLPNELPNGGKMWALLVAGSQFFINYRHQAAVCHAYQVMHSHGIPDENIVVMMNDDIAYDAKNKRPGILNNRPNGPNVYHGVPKDYTNKNVSADNFLNILEGIKTANTSKVIASGPNDHVFVFFTGHGGPSLSFFPYYGKYGYLKATDMIAAIKRKHENHGYSKMVLYWESCESGSMFDGLLPDDINVYATTASNVSESSYACYWDPSLNTCLGDIFSTKWMEDADLKNLKKETLEEQFVIIKNKTWMSKVSKFGDMSFSNLTLAEFFGAKSSQQPSSYDQGCDKPIIASEVPKFILEQKLLAAETLEEQEEARRVLTSYLQYSQIMQHKMRSIVESVTLDDEKTSFMLGLKTPLSTQHDCYYSAVNAFHTHCYNLGQHDQAIRLLFVLANLCEEGYNHDVIISAIEDNCRQGQQPRIEVY